MSLFAGVYSIKRQKPIGKDLVERITRVFPDTDETQHIFCDPHFFLVKFDFGAFTEPGFVKKPGSGIATLAGMPIFSENQSESYSRLSDLKTLCQGLSHGNIDLLRSCHGTYALCYYDPSVHMMILATDKLGARPLYYYSDNNFVYFSTSLKVFKALPQIPKKFHEQAFVEQHFFYYPLGNNTHYCEIKVLRDGEYLRVQDGILEQAFYFRWDCHTHVHGNRNDLLQQCYDNFKAAIKSRSHNLGQSAYSFLSGGLDSRSVIAMLQELGHDVIALNSSREGEQDQIFAERYARSVGIRYVTTPREPDALELTAGRTTARLLSSTYHNGLEKLAETIPTPPQSKLIFSGDGGGEAIGFIQLDDHLFTLLKAGKMDEAIQEFLHHSTLPGKIIRPHVLQDWQERSFYAMKRELEDLHMPDPDRRLYVFLLRNDLRRHLHDYHEHLDVYRVELLLPFYDARFIEMFTSTSLPTESFLYHRFYHDWLQLFPETIRAVPWQTYPDHLPCPLVKTEKIPTQWNMLKQDARVFGNTLMKQCFSILWKKPFPSHIINRQRVLIPLVLHYLHQGDYTYIFRFCLNLYENISNYQEYITEK